MLDVFRRHLEQAVTRFEKEQIRITASIGLAVRSPGEDLTSLIQRADAQLYEAKQSGRNRVMVDGAVL